MYKKFEAETLHAARQKMKNELGPDAVVVSQREIRKGGITGMLGNKIWQVMAYKPEAHPPKEPDLSAAHVFKSALAGSQGHRTAAASRPDPQRRPATRVMQPVNHVLDAPALPFADMGDPVPPRPAPSKAQSIAAALAAAAQRPKPSPAPAPGVESAVMKALIRKMQEISDQLNVPKTQSADHVILPGVLPAIYHRLIQQDVPRDMAVDIMTAVCDRPTLDLNDETKALEAVEELMASEIKTAGIDDLYSSRRPRVLFMVGPAGVGKTTTLAKLAMTAVHAEKMRIAFITLDTFRLAAAEQLKMQTEMMQADRMTVDLEIVMSGDEFISALLKHSDKDIVMVDTPGINPCSPASLSHFSDYLSRVTAAKFPPPTTLLALSAATKTSDLQRYASCYRSLDPAGIVFTKMDETTTYGSILEVGHTSKLPLVFFTCGQDIPNDIEPAHPRRLARKILC